MSAMLKFELVSPEKMIVSRDAAMITIPGELGDYSVLAGHAPLITTIRPGVVDIYDTADGAPVDRLFIDGGFAETTAERCTILADKVLPVSQLDGAALQEDLRKLSDRISAPEGEQEALHREMQVVQAKLLALTANQN